MKTYNCIIIDDELIDRLTVEMFAKRVLVLDILGVFPSAEDALPILEKENVDILFLDIDMPSVNGFEFRKMAAHVPVCIFITAHPEHAVESFGLDTLDFMVKPITFERFSKTMMRIEDYMELRHKASRLESALGGDLVYIKEGHEQTEVKLHDIFYLEALRDYTKIATGQKQHCVLVTLGALLKEPHFGTFIRVHRSYAVQRKYIQKVLPNKLMLSNGAVIPVGRSYRESLNSIL